MKWSRNIRPRRRYGGGESLSLLLGIVAVGSVISLISINETKPNSRSSKSRSASNFLLYLFIYFLYKIPFTLNFPLELEMHDFMDYEINLPIFLEKINQFLETNENEIIIGICLKSELYSCSFASLSPCFSLSNCS